MLTVCRVIAFIQQYRRTHDGELPPYVELSDEEAAQLFNDASHYVWRSSSRPGPTSIYGVPIRIVE